MILRKGSRVRMGQWTGTVVSSLGGTAQVQWDERYGAEEETEYLMSHDTSSLTLAHVTSDT